MKLQRKEVRLREREGLADDWRGKKWYVKIGRYGCYSDSLWRALFGALSMMFPDRKSRSTKV